MSKQFGRLNETAFKDAADCTWMLPPSPKTGILRGIFTLSYLSHCEEKILLCKGNAGLMSNKEEVAGSDITVLKPLNQCWTKVNQMVLYVRRVLIFEGCDGEHCPSSVSTSTCKHIEKRQNIWEGVPCQSNRRIHLQKTRGEKEWEVTFRQEICDLDVLVAEWARQM